MTFRKMAVIIDDNAEFLQMIEGNSFRKKVNLSLKYFSKPLEALAFIEENAQYIETVFTDYHMNSTKVDGGVVVAKCRRFNIPVYLVTGDDNVASSYAEDGYVDGTVDRTVASTEIFEIIKTISEKKQGLAA